MVCQQYLPELCATPALLHNAIFFLHPIKHISHFEETPKEIINSIAIVLEKTLKILKKKLNNPDFNLFIHTAPTVEENKYNCYHWHIEIIPKISISAGFELSTGIEITVIDPNEAIKFLKS